MKKIVCYGITGLVCLLIILLGWLLHLERQSNKSNLYINSKCGFSLMYPSGWHPVDGIGDNISFVNDSNDSGIYFPKIDLNIDWNYRPTVEGLESWAYFNYLGIDPPYKREMQFKSFNGNKFVFGVYDTTEHKDIPNTIAGFRNDRCGFIVIGYSGSLDASEFEKFFENFLVSMNFDNKFYHR